MLSNPIHLSISFISTLCPCNIAQQKIKFKIKKISLINSNTVSSPTLPQLAHQVQHGKELCQFCSHNPGARLIGTHITRPSSTVLPRQGAGPTLPCTAASEEQEKLFCSPDPEVSSPVCRSWQGRRASFPYPDHHMADMGGSAFLPSSLQDWLTCTSAKRQLYSVARSRYSIHLPECCSW